ncbi:MAG: hypothetical protein AAGE18_15370 [Pseudomonadota bacterium]
MDGAETRDRQAHGAASDLRVMLYSHDTYGLGHLRRARAIAQAMTGASPSLSALIMTGSPVAGRFDFSDRVDYVRLPGVVKTADGDYASRALRVDVAETVQLRSAILAATDATFTPDVLIVDKEAWGFRNELADTLAAARARGARIVLGVRDVLDAPEPLRQEWQRKGHVQAITSYFDEIWVYGLPDICRPLDGVGLPSEWDRRTVYTGYLRREVPDWPAEVGPQPPDHPYVLVTTGGGGDGAGLIDWALRAYETDPTLEPHAVLVYGPFLPPDQRADFDARARKLGDRVQVLSFDSRLERWMERADGVIAMGGYNTFCEILSLDKRALIWPRTAPRLEQLVRAEAAERLNLVRVLRTADDKCDPAIMAEAIRGLPFQAKPSAVEVPGLLDGLDAIVARVGLAPTPRVAAIAGS